MRKIFNAENVDLSHFRPLRVVHAPLTLYTEAVQITRENIGGLALLFESEILSAVPGAIYFKVMAERTNEQDNKFGIYRVFELSDWIVSLWGELHKFQDDVFKNTFDFVDAAPETVQRPAWDQDGAYNETLTRTNFQVNDRVCDRATGLYGIVTVLDIDMDNGTSGVEVLLDNQEYVHVDDRQLVRAMTVPRSMISPEQAIRNPQHEAPFTGTVEGPDGTSIMPRVQD